MVEGGMEGPRKNSAIRGIVSTGRGLAAGFTRLDWVVAHLIEHHGIDPYPGTLNLRLDASAVSAWSALRAQPSSELAPPDATACGARWHAVRAAGVPAVAVVPQVAGYGDDTIELVAALGLREHAALAEGTEVMVEPAPALAPRAVLFDVDGTLVDSLPAYIEIAQAAAQPEGITVGADEVRRALAFGRPFWDHTLAPDRADRRALMERMMARARAAWPAAMLAHCRAIPGLSEALDALARRGVRLGIVTGARPEVVALVRQLGVGAAFEAVVGNTDVRRRKPDPEGILLALERMGVAPGDALYVGDSPIDIEAAHRAGVLVVGVLTGAGSSAELARAGADRMVGSVARLPDVLQP